MDIDFIQQLEEISMNAWASPYQTMYDGWVLRYANGYTRRANSVIPLYPSNVPLNEKIQRCERFYEQRALPTYFKVTNASYPQELDGVLAEHGYAVIAQTSVHALDLTRKALSHQLDTPNIDVRSYPSPIWIETFCFMNKVRPMYHQLVRQMFADHLLQPANFIMLWEGKTPIATAVIVIERGFAGIFDVIVHPQMRGRGVGRQLMEYVLWLSGESGAHTAYLQVTLSNPTARALYESLGFREAYQYWYREKGLAVG